MASRKPQAIPSYVKKDLQEQDINIGIKLFRKCLEKLEIISEEKPAFDSQRVKNLINQIRQTLLDVYGEQSFEYQSNKHYEICEPFYAIYENTDDENQKRFLDKLPDCKEFLKHWIETLEDKKELLNSQTTLPREKPSTPWHLLHPQVTLIAKTRFDSGNYADSVEAVFKEINTIVKDVYKKRTGQELDGTTLMQNAFKFDLKKTPEERPVIGFNHLSSDSEKNIQEGYRFIFSGAIQAIRNPKAHANIEIDEKRCLHFLMLGSLLFHQLEIAGVKGN